MSPLMERALERVASLPAVEQDVIAALILCELDADRRLPLTIPEVNQLHEGKGFIYLEDEFLVFHFVVLNFGVTEDEWETVKVEPALIDGIRVKRGLFWDRLMIATRNRRLLEAIPGKHEVEISLRTRRAHRLESGAFVGRVLAWRRAAVLGLASRPGQLTSPE